MAKATNTLTTIDADLHVNSHFVQSIDLCFNQFVLPMGGGKIALIETGFRREFSRLAENLAAIGVKSSAISAVVVPHFEADEMGAIADVLAHAPAARVYAHPICAYGLEDVFGVKVRRLGDGERIPIGNRELLAIHTPHVHQWDSIVVIDCGTKRLFSSDLFIQHGPFRGLVPSDERAAMAIAAADGYLPSQKHLSAAITKLMKLDIHEIYPMHGTAVCGDVERYFQLLLHRATDSGT